MNIQLSIVVPVMNEEESLPELYSQIKIALKDYHHEVLFIDDGSTDGSLTLLKDMEKEHDNVRVYSFRRNMGKSHALMLGFQRAKGKYVATLDADLQDDPSDISVLLEYLEKENLDVVAGWRVKRNDTSTIKMGSRFANRMIASFFKVSIHDLNCGLKVYKKDAAADLKLYGGLHRFIPLIADGMGYNVGEHPVTNRKRLFGQSKYKASKIFTDLPDLFTIYFLTKYTTRPLHFFGRIGLIPFLGGVGVLLYLSYLRLFLDKSIGTRPLLTFGVLMVIFGMQIILTGLIADLIVHINTRKEDHFPLRYESTK